MNNERSCAYDNGVGDNAIGRTASGPGAKRQRTDGGKNGSHSLMGASSTTGSGQSDQRNGKRNNACSPDVIKSSYTKLDPIRVIGSGSFGKYQSLLSFCVLEYGWVHMISSLCMLCVSYP